MLVLTLPSGTGPTGRLCTLKYGCEADRVSSRLINTCCFGTKFFAATFKFVFLSTMSTFEVTGCVLVVIGGERENTHEAVCASLELTMLRKGKDKKSFLTFLLQLGSFALFLAATSRRYNCSLRFDFVRADADIASFSFSSFIRATARDCSISTSRRCRNSASAR